ncbi:hypothetical protein EDB83DRAFT_2321819 [Lactarius deliciosus]|nr:hypothetical protein EDB83DRAFT_2321819 [Lactarius deliciosus]
MSIELELEYAWERLHDMTNTAVGRLLFVKVPQKTSGCISLHHRALGCGLLPYSTVPPSLTGFHAFTMVSVPALEVVIVYDWAMPQAETHDVLGMPILAHNMSSSRSAEARFEQHTLQCNLHMSRCIGTPRARYEEVPVLLAWCVNAVLRIETPSACGTGNTEVTMRAQRAAFHFVLCFPQGTLQPLAPQRQQCLGLFSILTSLQLTNYTVFKPPLSKRNVRPKHKMAAAAEPARGQDTSHTTRSTEEASGLNNQSLAPTQTPQKTVASSLEPPTTSKCANPTIESDGDSSDHNLIRHHMFLGSKKSRNSIVVDESDEERHDASQTWKLPKPGSKDALRQSDAVDKDGFLIDVDVQSISDAPKVSLKDQSRDVDHFFTPAFVKKDKNYCNCSICFKKSPKHPVSLVADVTTCRRHMELFHKGAYLKHHLNFQEVVMLL